MGVWDSVLARGEDRGPRLGLEVWVGEDGCMGRALISSVL